MIISTKDFKEVANTILLATELDKVNARLELVTKKGNLYLNTTNKEFYAAVKFPLSEEVENVRAVVDASAFLNLVSGITADEFELIIDTQKVTIKVGRSNYKIPMIFENNELLVLEPIKITNVRIEMPIGLDILKSILNVNSRELLKLKNIVTASEAQKLYYLDETGCYTITTGACKNSFNLEKPIKLLLNDRIVKLFKLFKDDPYLSFGYDQAANGSAQQKITLQTENVYVAALVTCDDKLINQFSRAINLLKDVIEANYENKVVVDSNDFNAAITRLMQFAKNTNKDLNVSAMQGIFTFKNNEMLITDSDGNIDTVEIENESRVSNEYQMTVNLSFIKSVLDSCKNEHITMNFGDHKSIIINHGLVTNYIPETRA